MSIILHLLKYYDNIENKYFAMAEGKQVGIYNKDVPAQDGSAHTNVYYNVEAQKFIISKFIIREFFSRIWVKAFCYPF